MTLSASLSGPLREEIQRLRQEIPRLKQKHIGEQDTKSALIEPLLAALGWDTKNVDQVTREYKHQSQANPVDYALLLEGKPCVLIEAKALGTNLEDFKCISQIVSYAAAAGVNFCLLTDGDEYRLYQAHAPVEAPEKLLWAIRISVTAEEEALEKLALLSPESFRQGALKLFMALQKLFANDSSPLVRWLRKECPDISVPDIKAFLPRVRLKVEATQEGDGGTRQRGGISLPTHVLPSKFPYEKYFLIQGERFDCQNSQEVLLYTAEWLIKQGKIKKEDCPIILTKGTKTKKRYLIHTEPHHLHRPFSSPKKLSNGLWIEMDLGAYHLPTITMIVRRLLRWAGYSEDILEVHWEN